ncbi:GGDEF domain-containing protein [bacterium]|nr:MAG: GGDEF domain-containing protein [bacterium]
MLFRRTTPRVEAEVVDDWVLEAARVAAKAGLADPASMRRTIVEAIGTHVPEVDGVLFVEHAQGKSRSLEAWGHRFERYGDVSVNLGVAAGEERELSPDERLHPSDLGAVLLGLDEEIAGVGTAGVYLASGRCELRVEILEDVREFVSVVSPVYALCRAREQDQVTANYDGLTGVLRASTMRARLRQLANSGRDVVFAFCDGDHFKAWNDRYGHASGNLAIQHLAKTIERHRLGPADLVGRMGGDEFGIAFVDASKADAVRQAVRICLALAAANISDLTMTDEQAAIQITASIGVAMLGEDASDDSELLARADEATYQSKAHGRDCVTYIERGRFVHVSDEERRVLSYEIEGSR